jgi:hypothetical protein
MTLSWVKDVLDRERRRFGLEIPWNLIKGARDMFQCYM